MIYNEQHRRAAIHEAAHAVVAAILGVPLDLVRVMPGADPRDSPGGCSPTQVDPDSLAPNVGIERMTNAIIVAEAGRAADRAISGCEYNEDKYFPDLHSAKACANWLRSKGQPVLDRAPLRERAAELVDLYRHLIIAVADTLCDPPHQLSGDQLQSLCGSNALRRTTKR